MCFIFFIFFFSTANLLCHEECLGGCSNITANDCNLCKHYRIYGTDECVYKCPPDLYTYNILCVNASFCESKRLKPILGECRDLCPPIIRDQYIYVKNIDQCALECPAIEIQTLQMSDLVRGCQIIKGDVNIQLQSGVADTMQILERNLGDIEEIEGILKIYRSPAITSLSFFRNLRIIRGNQIQKTRYTFVIISNENLQELWNFNEKKSLELSHGNLLVHFNSKLCLSEIHQLQTLLNTNKSADFIGDASNGYEYTCVAQSIVTEYRVLNSSNVEISWNKISILETEKIIGYIVYYIVAPSQNLTHVGIDTCVQ